MDCETCSMLSFWIRGSVGQRCGERGNVREGRSAP